MPIAVNTTLIPTADVSVGAGVSAVVVAANVNRKNLIITSLSSNSAAGRVGDNTVTATKGAELMPGGSIELRTTAAVSIFNTHSAGQSFSILEEV